MTTPEPKSITIITTVHLPKKGKGGSQTRPITVAAAPEGELPIMLTGDFAQRHALADQAYGALLKRKPQIVKSGATRVSKPKKNRRKSPRTLSQSKGDLIETAQAALSQPDAEETGPIGPPDVLPVIEGDAEPQAQLEMNLEADND